MCFNSRTWTRGILESFQSEIVTYVELFHQTDQRSTTETVEF